MGSTARREPSSGSSPRRRRRCRRPPPRPVLGRRGAGLGAWSRRAPRLCPRTERRRRPTPSSGRPGRPADCHRQHNDLLELRDGRQPLRPQLRRAEAEREQDEEDEGEQLGAAVEALLDLPADGDVRLGVAPAVLGGRSSGWLSPSRCTSPPGSHSSRRPSPQPSSAPACRSPSWCQQCRLRSPTRAAWRSSAGTCAARSRSWGSSRTCRWPRVPRAAHRCDEAPRLPALRLHPLDVDVDRAQRGGARAAAQAARPARASPATAAASARHACLRLGCALPVRHEPVLRAQKLVAARSGGNFAPTRTVARATDMVVVQQKPGRSKAATRSSGEVLRMRLGSRHSSCEDRCGRSRRADLTLPAAAPHDAASPAAASPAARTSLLPRPRPVAWPGPAPPPAPHPPPPWPQQTSDARRRGGGAGRRGPSRAVDRVVRAGGRAGLAVPPSGRRRRLPHRVPPPSRSRAPSATPRPRRRITLAALAALYESRWAVRHGVDSTWRCFQGTWGTTSGSLCAARAAGGADAASA